MKLLKIENSTIELTLTHLDAQLLAAALDAAQDHPAFTAYHREQALQTLAALQSAFQATQLLTHLQSTLPPTYPTP